MLLLQHGKGLPGAGSWGRSPPGHSPGLLGGPWAPRANTPRAAAAVQAILAGEPDAEKATGRDRTMGLPFLWKLHLRVRGWRRR